jgi:hypothetical protein
MSDRKDVQKVASTTLDAVGMFNPIRLLSGWGIRSRHAYAAGFASVVVSLVAWILSRSSKDSKAQSDRWGLFIGEWAPTFFAIGVALRLEEGPDRDGTKG